MKIDFARRLSDLEAAIKKHGLDSFFVTTAVNVSYLSGFKGHDAMLLLTPDKRYFITDSRYYEEARKTLKGFDIALVETTTYDTVKKLVAKSGSKRLGFESMNLQYAVVSRLKRLFGRAVKLAALKDLVEQMRSIKDPEEIRLIRDSVALAKGVLAKTLKMVRPGTEEISLGRAIEIAFIKNNARPAFDPIIASQANASKPHARPGRTRIEKNDLVMIDIGCILNGYNSDITRMCIVGSVEDKLKKIYGIVAAAQNKALEAIKPGVKISKIDGIARGHIEKEGFGKYFGHALGHGVGMEIHESPTVSGSNDAAVRPGMVFTVEPAIYVPGLGGVRIEDMVLVTDNGCKILTR